MEMNNQTMEVTVANLEDIYPLAMAIATTLMSLFGVFGNALIIIATFLIKSLHHRCNILIATLALADMIACVYFVQLRIIVMNGGFYWTNAKCFLWSVHGLFALNVQSGMGLVLGVDRLLAIVQPIRYRQWNSGKYLVVAIFPVLCYSVVLVGYGWSQTINIASAPICLPPTAYATKARTLWVFSSVFIVFLVLLAYGTAQYKVRQANDSSSSDESVMHGKRLLISLSCVMVVYSATWALTVLALFANQTLLPPSVAHQVELQAGWLVIINSSSSVVIYAWRGQDYRKAFVKIISCGIYYYDDGFKRRSAVNALKMNHN